MLAAPAAAADEDERETLAAVERVRWNEARVDRFLRELPKAELHVHLDGALSPELIAKLAAKRTGSPLSGRTPSEIAKLSVVSTNQPSLAKVLEAFRVVYPLLRDREALRLAAYETVRRAARSNVRYLEVRFAPELQAAPGFDAEEVLRAAIAGLDQGRREFDVKWGVIVCLLRPDGLMDMKRNEAMVELALRMKSFGVVGVDLAGDEAAAPLSAYASLLRRAKEGGLGVTVHAGEVPGSKDLETALELGVDRLGHATLLAGKPELAREVAERRIPVEINLTSNLRTSAVKSLAEHPARRLRELGIPLAVSTDDPGVFDIELNDEYRLLRDELGFGPRELLDVSLRALDAAFLPAEEKARLRADFHRAARGLLDALAEDR